ncbi:MAG: hypothetical protein ACI8VT_002389 [Saprospiraceae bacterium]|jgi:hypothetical protein
MRIYYYLKERANKNIYFICFEDKPNFYFKNPTLIS